MYVSILYILDARYQTWMMKSYSPFLTRFSTLYYDYNVSTYILISVDTYTYDSVVISYTCIGYVML